MEEEFIGSQGSQLITVLEEKGEEEKKNKNFNEI